MNQQQTDREGGILVALLFGCMAFFIIRFLIG